MKSEQRSLPVARTRRSNRDRREIVTGLQSARVMSRAWSAGVPDRQRQQAAWAFIKAAIDEYIAIISRTSALPIQAPLPAIALTYELDHTVAELARSVGREAAELPIEQACFQLSATYTVLVPSSTRSKLGMYYTPPALTERLLDMAEEAGTDWCAARILDPACGGGAFLLPVALRMRKALAGTVSAKQLLQHFADQLHGFEIDPFAAWLTQTWLVIAFRNEMAECDHAMPQLVKVCDTLAQEPNGKLYDLVIGNPPYGRISLTPEQRRNFSRGLYGHANLYGVFTDIALRWTKPFGVIAYVTPTSFLAGEYFKALRSLLGKEAPPVAIDFIDARRGVFEDVLQEALLATYRKGGGAHSAAIHHLGVTSDTTATLERVGQLSVPSDHAGPWFAPRRSSHQLLIDRLSMMPHRLESWGYQVSTGPLVWNRFKSQLRTESGKDIFPLVWAEAVAGLGKFIHRAEMRGHRPYFKVNAGDEWLKVCTPCVLVQRTTAKEQPRRLIAAAMPSSFINKHGAVIVENHLNMIKPISEKPKVSPAAVSALMNSAVVDESFRCISGSVAVSAFELEALPVPSPEAMVGIEKLIRDKTGPDRIEVAIRALYFGGA